MKQKEPTATFTLRLPRDLGNQIQQRASAVRMSMNAWVLRAIDGALVKEVTAPPPGSTSISKSDIERRALLTRRKAAAQQEGAYQKPSSSDGYEVGDSAYAKLVNVNSVLEVHHVPLDRKLEG